MHHRRVRAQHCAFCPVTCRSELDHVGIVSIICRSDNYFIALFHADWFARRLFLCTCRSTASPCRATRRSRAAVDVHPAPMEPAALPVVDPLSPAPRTPRSRLLLLSYPHFEPFQVKSGTDADRRRMAVQLQTSFRWLAVANLVLSPFVGIVRIAYFCFENTGAAACPGAAC